MINSEKNSKMAVQRQSKPQIAYIHDENIGLFHYGSDHPMKPFRLNLTYGLVLAYGMHKYMSVYKPAKASVNDLAKFHSREYIDLLKSSESLPAYSNLGHKHAAQVVNDCPAFPGLYEYCLMYTGASLAGARLLNDRSFDIAINWSGGLHHAKKAQPSGFCYVNDIVLGICEMLQHFQRVLYIDIDVHHGDGVQEAFYLTDRVMTVSFHRYGEGFFPGTGHMLQLGVNAGKFFSLNVPLKEGMDDESYEDLFKPIMDAVRQRYRPEAVVLQCGADSLGGDRLGRFSLSIRGHGKCVDYIKSWNLPLLVLGGGGYTAKNVARCWTYETSVLCGQDIDNNIPEHYEFVGYFGPDYTLHPNLAGPPNQNTKKYLQTVKQFLCESLKNIEFAPSVQMHETLYHRYPELQNLTSGSLSSLSRYDDGDTNDEPSSNRSGLRVASCFDGSEIKVEPSNDATDTSTDAPAPLNGNGATLASFRSRNYNEDECAAAPGSLPVISAVTTAEMTVGNSRISLFNPKGSEASVANSAVVSTAY